MSLVGTRPILPDELEQYELHHRARIAIKPGITGMWQVSGRSDITDFEEIVRLDTEYMPSIIEYYKEKTIHIAIGTGMAAIINIVLNAIFIPRYGYVAAAYTTLISYFCYYLYHSLISYRIIGFSMVPMKVNILWYFIFNEDCTNHILQKNQKDSFIST